jgi:hypothetical protein
VVTSAAVRQQRATTGGAVQDPIDPAYEAARRIWNGAVPTGAVKAIGMVWLTLAGG